MALSDFIPRSRRPTESLKASRDYNHNQDEISNAVRSAHVDNVSAAQRLEATITEMLNLRGSTDAKVYNLNGRATKNV